MDSDVTDGAGAPSRGDGRPSAAAVGCGEQGRAARHINPLVVGRREFHLAHVAVVEIRDFDPTASAVGTLPHVGEGHINRGGYLRVLLKWRDPSPIAHIWRLGDGRSGIPLIGGAVHGAVLGSAVQRVGVVPIHETLPQVQLKHCILSSYFAFCFDHSQNYDHSSLLEIVCSFSDIDGSISLPRV